MTEATNRAKAQAMVDDDFYVVRALPPGHGDPLYPAYSTVGQGPVLINGDGIPTQTEARAITVFDPIRSTNRPVMHFEGIRATVSVTRSRVIIFCEDYDKGGGFGFFMGGLGLLLALGSWVIRRLRANSRSKGLVLAGQIWRTDLKAMTHDRNEVTLTSTSPKSGRPLVTIIEFADVFQAGQLASAIGAVPSLAAAPPPPGTAASTHQPPPP